MNIMTLTLKVLRHSIWNDFLLFCTLT